MSVRRGMFLMAFQFYKVRLEPLSLTIKTQFITNGLELQI